MFTHTQTMQCAPKMRW